MENILSLIADNLWIVQLGAIITAVGILWQKVFYPLYKWGKQAKNIMANLEAGYPILEDLIREINQQGKFSLNEKFKAIDKDMWLRRERHRIYQELEESAVFETDEEGGYVWVSEGWINLFGQNTIEASGYGWLAGVNSLDRDRVSNEWTVARAQKRQFKMKFRIRENGKAKWIKCTALPVKDSDGVVYCYIGKIEEIKDNTQLNLDEVLKP